MKALWRKPVASLVTCRGRRRIGKSTLIEEFARRNRVRFIKLEGVEPQSGVNNETQLTAFARQLAEQTGCDDSPLGNWFNAFARLAKTLNPREKTVLLIDEISWMGKYDAAFPGELKYAWDNRFSKNPKLIMVLCGSVSSWIDKKILKSRGFVGRPSLNLLVPELSMRECAAFWRRGGCKVSSTEIIDVLSVTGGVPKYLENVDPSMSADENIKRLCFMSGALLVDEFDEIFNDALDANLGLKRRMLMSLGEGMKTPTEVAEALGLQNNGHLSACLAELETAGFVAKDTGLNPSTGKRSNVVRYRISDNYTRFYLKFIEPNRELIRKGTFTFISLAQLPGWNAALGLQFECLVYNNIRQIIRRIGLDQTLILSAAPYVQNPTARAAGCQIDLLVQTRRMLYVVEIKRRESVGEWVVSEVEEKLSKLKTPSNVSVIPVLVYDGNLSRRVPADGYFGCVISARELLGLPCGAASEAAD
ncbi:MAG: AAA family ATPase [Kiritimatiellae bacterium]|nr:AAA family ATPase [Kiritimatiellia bacterium]MBQ3344119.1 AAA family ATPase [Kiritimatiellia bacterium]MBQ6329502.1 AAA family ATPase [Kiritimatiellia bacterium]